MFDQIKTEPLHFYQSSCPTQITTQIVPQHQTAAVLQQQNQVQHTVITINDDKDNLQNVSEDFVVRAYFDGLFTATQRHHADPGGSHQAGNHESDAAANHSSDSDRRRCVANDGDDDNTRQ